MEDESVPYFYRDDIAQPPKSKSRRSTMFSFRKNSRSFTPSESTPSPEALPRHQEKEREYPQNENMPQHCSFTNDKWMPNSVTLPKPTSPVKKMMKLDDLSKDDLAFQPHHDMKKLALFPRNIASVSACLPENAPAPRLPLAAVSFDRPLFEKKSASPLLHSQALEPIVNKSPLASSSSGAQDVAQSSALPLSPAQHSAIVAKQKAQIDALTADLANLQAVLSTKEDALQSIEHKLTKRDACEDQLKNMHHMAIEEIHTLTFTVAIMEQKISELENNVSVARIEKNEALSHRSKKYKAAISKINKERGEYEERANGVIQQMNEQMASLQAMAMERIELLEKQLMDSRRENEELKTRVQLLNGQLLTNHTHMPSSPASSGGGSRRSTVSPQARHMVPADEELSEESREGGLLQCYEAP